MATLKISDLSVGDWVYHDDIVFGREIAQIHRLHKDKKGEVIGITVYRSDGAFGVVGYILISPTHGGLHPIPITPEILEANGWKRNEENEYMEYYGDPTSSIAHTKGTYHYRLEATEVSVVCYSVQELQHALRLARVDKEIVMPNK